MIKYADPFQSWTWGGGFLRVEEESKARRAGRREIGGGSYRDKGDSHKVESYR